MACGVMMLGYKGAHRPSPLRAPGLPMDFAQFRASAADLPGPDEAAAAHTRAREATLTKPPGSLGRLEALAEWAARWQGRSPPAAERIQVLIFAGNHGVAAQGVSAYSAQVTAQMVANFAAGGAAINQLADALGAHLDVHALDLARPTVDFTQGPAMSEAECAEALATGMNRVDPAADLLCLGEMGIGNTTSAAALCYAVLGGEAADWVGPGTGMSGDALANKIQVVETAVARAQSDDPLAQLAQVGGREIAALTGAVLGARKARIPVVLDGFICTAAAVPLFVLNRSSLDHCLAGHRATEPGHGRLLEALAMEPLLDLGLRLGEGSGAVLAAGIVKAAIACHTGMATFDEAGVTNVT